MKRNLVALGILSPLFLAVCAVGLLLTGLAGWWIFKPDPRAPVIKKIATVGPLLLPDAAIPPPAAINPPAATTAQAVTQPITSSNDAAAAVAPQPAANIEPAPTFVLPPNTVSVANPAGVATRLVIPKLKVDAPVLLAPIKNQTWDVSQLKQEVGHLEGTAPPGSNSNIVLAGHITLAAGVYGPFAGLAQLSAGDEVMVYEGAKAFRYIIDGYELVERTSVEVTHPTATGQITLITCSNWNRDTNRYDQRIVVRGHLAQ